MKDSFKKALRGARQTIVLTVVLMLLCGLLFPVVLTGISALIFPKQANGNLITVNDKPVGAEYVGQEFTKDYFLWSRPSAYHHNVYHEDEDGKRYYSDGTKFPGVGSGSDNFAPSNPELANRVERDIEAFLKNNPEIKRKDLPADLLTASGSGLDPHISPESAEVQIPRIVKASGLSENIVRTIIARHTEDKLLGVFGEKTVNVLMVNIEIAKEMGIL